MFFSLFRNHPVKRRRESDPRCSPHPPRCGCSGVGPDTQYCRNQSRVPLLHLGCRAAARGTLWTGVLGSRRGAGALLPCGAGTQGHAPPPSPPACLPVHAHARVHSPGRPPPTPPACPELPRGQEGWGVGSRLGARPPCVRRTRPGAEQGQAAREAGWARKATAWGVERLGCVEGIQFIFGPCRAGRARLWALRGQGACASASASAPEKRAWAEGLGRSVLPDLGVDRSGTQPSACPSQAKPREPGGPLRARGLRRSERAPGGAAVRALQT